MWTTMLTAIAALVLLVGGTAWAQETPPEDSHVFGVGAGQIFRLAVSGVGARDSTQVCHATLSIRDTENRPLPGLSREVSVRSGQFAFLDLDTRGLKPRTRIDFYAVVTPKADSGPCQPSFHVLEVLSGRGVAFDTPSSIPIETQPPVNPPCPDLRQLEHPFVFLGIGQTAQFGVVCSRQFQGVQLPCDGILQFSVGANVSLATGPLTPGQSRILSLNANTLNLNFGETAGFLPEDIATSTVNLLFPGHSEPCPVPSNAGFQESIQVLDSFTNWTTVFWAP